VLATQNPIEMEGTYPLPEAQVDRFFFKIDVRPQGEEELLGIIDRTTGDDVIDIKPVLTREAIIEMQHTARQVLVAEFVQRYAARVALGTHPDSPFAIDDTRQFVRFGVSPRGVQALVLAGKVRALLADRVNVSCQDIRDVARPALRHRIIRNFEAEAEGITTDRVLEALLLRIEEPAA
jgi:MoxR-like ATPase